MSSRVETLSRLKNTESIFLARRFCTKLRASHNKRSSRRNNNVIMHRVYENVNNAECPRSEKAAERFSLIKRAFSSECLCEPRMHPCSPLARVLFLYILYCVYLRVCALPQDWKSTISPRPCQNAGRGRAGKRRIYVLR